MGSTTPRNDTSPMLPRWAHGDVLELQTPDGGSVKVTVLRLVSLAISPVLEVELHTPDGYKVILKFYDRRIGGWRRAAPYTQQAEIAWQECVRSGLAKELIEGWQDEGDKIIARRLRTANESDDESSSGDDDDDDVDKAQLKEASIYYTLQKIYKTEVRAYSELQHLQGHCIPRLISSILDTSRGMPADLPIDYFHVPGILIEYIEGFPLVKLMSRIPDQPDEWIKIIKQAMAIAEEINDAGVLHDDCLPRNIIVAPTESNQYQIYFIDFVYATFKVDYKDTNDFLDSDGFLRYRL